MVINKRKKREKNEMTNIIREKRIKVHKGATKDKEEEEEI